MTAFVFSESDIRTMIHCADDLDLCNELTFLLDKGYDRYYVSGNHDIANGETVPITAPAMRKICEKSGHDELSAVCRCMAVTGQKHVYLYGRRNGEDCQK